MAKQVEGKQSNRKKAPENETPADAFRRLAHGRTNRALKAIGLIGQLAGTAYESTDVQKRAIVAALKVAVTTVADAFEGKGKADDKFRLPE